MADENVPDPAPTRFVDQILPFTVWMPSKRATMAFTASASVPAIYIQQFWNTLTYVEKARTYRFQLDENWFTLDVNLLREALEITPIDQAHPFVSPPSGGAIMDFVNELGYPKAQISSKTSGHDRPRYPVLQMLWGIITIPLRRAGKSTKATPLQTAGKGKVAKVHTVKSSLQLVDEPNEEPAHFEPEPEHQGVAIQEPIIEAIRPLPVVEGKGKAIVTEEQAAQSMLALHTPKRRSSTDQFIFQRRTLATEEASTRPFAQPQDNTSANIVRDSPSPADAETGVGSDKTNSRGDTEILQINEELGEDVEK
ncbi:hypothetical protein Tco_1553630, partial [Tanacetum coccineum]